MRRKSSVPLASLSKDYQSSASSTESPRRIKPPIDIDAALYIQSQAANVQEPNSNNRIAATASGPRRDIQCHPNQFRQLHFSQPQQHQYANLRQQLPIGSSSYNNHNNICYAPNQTNISVDYIDCVSNTDLALSPHHVSGGGAEMRGIPSCRKHLSRFSRNRIDPNVAGASATPLPSAQPPPISTQPRSQSSSSSSSIAAGPIPATQNPIRKQPAPIATGSSRFEEDCATSSLSADGELLAAGEREGAASKSSVLYPIPVSEVKKRTYLIGSVHQDSLLGSDELHRYFPSGHVNIFVCTWNQNRKRAPMNLNDLLLPDQILHMPDIYAIGIQEAFSYQQDYLREWEIELQTTLGPNYVLLHSCSLGVLHLSLFIRRDLIWFCSIPEESLYNSRSMPTNMLKTKGAVSIAFRFFGTSFMFTNCHFPAHENKLKDRVDEYQRIINSIDLPKNLKSLKPRYLSNDSTARFDCVFFMGDLNFRLEQRTFDETVHILEDIFQQKDQSFEALTQNDELLKVMESQQAFNGFDEYPIKFPPTYKFLAQTNKYDRQTKRVPSYTDRILFRSKRQRHIQCSIYDWLPQLISSDHKPVYCLFEVLIRPGREQQNMVSSLNAGLFQRAVYLEALKRRAEDPDEMRCNDAGGNLICSIT